METTEDLRRKLRAAQDTLKSVVDEYTSLETEVLEKDRKVEVLRQAVSEGGVLLGCAQSLWDTLTSRGGVGVTPGAQRAMATCLASSERLQQLLQGAREPELAAACTLTRAPALMAAAAAGIGDSLRSEERAVLTTALSEVREHARRLEVALAEAQDARSLAVAASDRLGEELRRSAGKHAGEVEALGARLVAASAPASAILVDGEAYDARRVTALRAEVSALEARTRVAEGALDASRGELESLRGARAAAMDASAGASVVELEALRVRCREAEGRGVALEGALGGAREQVRLLQAQVITTSAAAASAAASASSSMANNSSSGSGSAGGGVQYTALLDLTAALRKQLEEQIALTEAATANLDASRLQVAESEAKLALLQQSKAELAHRAARAVRDVQRQAEALQALSITLKPNATPLVASAGESIE